MCPRPLVLVAVVPVLLLLTGIDSRDGGLRDAGEPERPDGAACSSSSGIALLQRGSAQSRTAQVDLLEERWVSSLQANGTHFSCHSSIVAKTTAVNARCPDSCPFWAEETRAGTVCNFRCVGAADCGMWPLDVNATIPDAEMHYCRRCSVPGCDTCSPHGGDLCAKCSLGYDLRPDGTCKSSFRHVWVWVVSVLGALVAFVLLWYFELRCRPVVNKDGLMQGLAYRHRTKLRTWDRDGSASPCGRPRRRLWPLTTNLLQAQVAGRGLALFFRSQVAIVIWAAVMLVGWVILAWGVDSDLLVLGTKDAITPRQFCTVVAWGHETQRDLMYWKVVYLVFAYVVTFILCIIHAVLQRRRFTEMDDISTMGDFAAFCTGLPRLDGSEQAEEKFRKLLEAETGQTLVGMSVCWDFKDKEEKVQAAVELLHPRRRRTTAASAFGHQQRFSSLRRRLHAVDALLGFSCHADAHGGEEPEGVQEAAAELVRGIPCSGSAFAVFETEEARDAAIRAAKDAGGLQIMGKRVRLKAKKTEPDSVIWHNFTSSEKHYGKRLACGVLAIAGSLLVWMAFFYLPYAYYVSSFTYAQGAEPGITSSLIFTLLVVAGNQLMYLVCGTVAERVGFEFIGDQEATYMVLYLAACFLNVILDLGITGWTSYKMMVGVGAHTFDGKLIETLTSFRDIFEAYTIQKALGSALAMYAFPSCFLLPFLLEPVFAIVLPYHVSTLLVRAHPEVQGTNAEKSLAIFTPMDLSRYADLLLNVVLAVLILFFPGGFTLQTLGGLILSHLFIYAYDQYRVLRCVPAFCYANRIVDDWANLLMTVPCGILAACLVFKADCLPGAPCATDGAALALRCLGAFALHVLLHWAALVWPVSWLGRCSHCASTNSYAEVAQEGPVTWFSVNPVHCLRSRFFYGHDPPCSFFVPGKENLLRRNTELGSYYTEHAADKRTSGPASFGFTPDERRRTRLGTPQQKLAPPAS